MPLDSLCIARLAGELSATLTGARIDKIHMPARDRVLIHLRGEGGAGRLLISAGSDARIHLTDTRPENPDAPPMLCMLLRKHLAGGRIVSVDQPGRERIVTLRITSAGELGDITEKQLICEMTGRMTNLILVGPDGLIMACLKSVSPEQSPRPVMAGLRYHLPPGQGKPDLLDMAEADIARLCADIDMEAAFEAISARVGGVSPLVLRECIHRAQGSREALAQSLAGLARLTPRPFMLIREGAYADFAPLEITQYPDGTCRQMESFSALLDAFYQERTERQTLKNLTGSMQKAVQTALKRTERKLAGQQQELLAARSREALKEKADLITANLHAIAPGQSRVVVTDFFDEALPQVELKLDGTKTPQQNAQALYKKYARLKNAEAALSAQIESGQAELVYLEHVLYWAGQVRSAQEAQELRQELVASGYLRDKDKSRKKPRAAAFAPRRYLLSHDFEALVGRNNVENDQLTHRHAQKQDIWLHARNIPGAHVILVTQGREVPQDTLEQAAALAALHSSEARSGRVAVDYCLARHVKKPQGARPGMVNYFNFKTLLAAPAEPSRE